MDHALGRVQAATGCGTVFSGAPGHDRPPGRGPQPGAPGLLRGGPPGALRDFDRRGRAGSARIAQPSRNSEARGARPAGDVGGPRRTFRRRRELGVELPFGNCFEIKPRSPPGSRCSLIRLPEHVPDAAGAGSPTCRRDPRPGSPHRKTGGFGVVDSRAAPAAREPWPPTRRSPRRLPQALTHVRATASTATCSSASS